MGVVANRKGGSLQNFEFWFESGRHHENVADQNEIL